MTALEVATKALEEAAPLLDEIMELTDVSGRLGHDEPSAAVGACATIRRAIKIRGQAASRALATLRSMAGAAPVKHEPWCGKTANEANAMVAPAPAEALATPGEAGREEAREIAHRIMTGLCRWPRGKHSAKCTEIRDAFIADRLAATPVAQRRPAREALTEQARAILTDVADVAKCSEAEGGRCPRDSACEGCRAAWWLEDDEADRRGTPSGR